MSVLTTRTKDHVRGNQPKCPCVLLLDTSGSMLKDGRIIQLNAGLHEFKKAVCEDEAASARVDIAIVTFSDRVELAMDWTLAIDFQPPILKAEGQTAMCQAILEAIALVKHRKQIYKEKGIPYFQPWIFMITDGEPTDPELLDAAKSALRTMEEQPAKLTFYAIGVEEANMDLLRSLSINPAFELKHLAFDDLFRWLGMSASKGSGRQPVQPKAPDTQTATAPQAGTVVNIQNIQSPPPPPVPPPETIVFAFPSKLIPTSRVEKV